MLKQILLEQLTTYRTGNLSRETLEENLDELYLSAEERTKNALDIHAIFVSLALSRLQAAPSERYNDEEMDQLIDALSGHGFVCYQAFYRISADMLTPSEVSILAVAKDFLSHADLGEPEKWLNEENEHIWQAIEKSDRSKRVEFTQPATVPAWIVSQLKYLLWIAMSEKKVNLLKLEREELIQKIAHECRLLSGENVAFVTVGNDFCSVI
ncbi:MAG: hypothetical protein IJW40_11535 [Clostridia bacterium]|nr:hypothetical protein [Clostridia bacterium]